MTGASARTRLFLIRHGLTAESARGCCIGRSDVPLSAAGHACAERLAVAFAQIPVDIVISSPLQRARGTAAPIAAVAGREVVVSGGLAEIDFGALEGSTFDEIASAHPDLYQRWMTAPARVHFPGGESYADLKARACAAMTEIMVSNRGAVIVVVSHGGPIRAVIASLLEMPDDAAFRLGIDHGGMAQVDWIGDKPTLCCLNGPINRVMA